MEVYILNVSRPRHPPVVWRGGVLEGVGLATEIEVAGSSPGRLASLTTLGKLFTQ